MPRGFPRAVAAWLIALAWLATAMPSAADNSSIELTGLTFVASRAGQREILLRSSRATLNLKARTAELFVVSAEVVDASEQRDFAIECERAVVEIETQNFLAEGAVRGHTGEGQVFKTESVLYDRETAELYSPTPVELTDASGSLRGDGFRYDVEERRFELLGNVRVEQGP